MTTKLTEWVVTVPGHNKKPEENTRKTATRCAADAEARKHETEKTKKVSVFSDLIDKNKREFPFSVIGMVVTTVRGSATKLAIF